MSEEATQTTETPASTESVAQATVEENGTTVSETSYLDGKYKSVSDLERGYKELQSSYSKKTAEFKEQLGAFSGAPEGEYELAEGLDVYDEVQAYAKDNQFSNEALNGLAEAYEAAEAKADQAHLAEQRELLGKDADARINNVVDWARANVGDEKMDALNQMVTTAQGVEIFETIMKLTQGTAQAPSQPAQKIDADTVRNMQMAKDEYGNRKMNDPAYAAKVRAMREQMS